MSQSAKLFIRLPQADYNALSDGKYFLNFTRDITTTTGELREVWDLKSLDGSKPVKDYESSPIDNGVRISVPLTILGDTGDIKYRLSFLMDSDKLANDQTPLNKETLTQSVSQSDPIIQTINTRAVNIDRTKSYRISNANTIEESSTSTTTTSANDSWTVRLQNSRKIRPIILRGKIEDFDIAYLGPWWIAGKGRLSLPQVHSVSIWFANQTSPADNDGVGGEDYSEATSLLKLKQGLNYEITYMSDVWGTEAVVAQ